MSVTATNTSIVLFIPFFVIFFVPFVGIRLSFDLTYLTLKRNNELLSIS